MTYTELFEWLYRDPYEAGCFDERVEDLLPSQRAAWNIIEELNSRSGFDFGGLEDEYKNEIFAAIEKIIGVYGEEIQP